MGQSTTLFVFNTQNCHSIYLINVRLCLTNPISLQGIYDPNGEDYNSFSELENYPRGLSPYQVTITFNGKVFCTIWSDKMVSNQAAKECSNSATTGDLHSSLKYK